MSARPGSCVGGMIDRPGDPAAIDYRDDHRRGVGRLVPSIVKQLVNNIKRCADETTHVDKTISPSITLLCFDKQP